MARMIQLELPFVDGIKTKDGDVRNTHGNNWYYLVDPIRQEMLITDDKGNYTWCAHDTISIMPFLFSSANLARQYANRIGKGQVHRYKWLVKK